MVDALAKLLAKDDKPHLFLFLGPSGTGKTTLGRIVADTLGCAQPLEIDAATNSGVEAMRSLGDYVGYKALDGRPKVVLIDEVHAISKAAWQASLKMMEEPPAHVYFILCTTDADKIPATVKTRATTFTLKPVGLDQMINHATHIAHKESIALPEGAIRYLVSRAQGSVRQLLVDIAMCEGAPDIPTVQRLLEEAVEDDALLGLSRMLVSNRRSFDRARTFLAALKETHEAESVRIGVVEYATSTFLNSSTTQTSLIRLLDLTSQPLPTRGGWAALIAALYAVLADG